MSADPVPSPTELAGKLITPDDSRYGLLRSTYTTVGRPAVVVLPQSAADVAAALRMARGRRLPLAVRSGGHGLSGRSTNNGGLVVDLSAMRRVEVVDRAARLVRVEAGARWARVARTWPRTGSPSAPATTATSESAAWPRAAASDGSYGTTG